MKYYVSQTFFNLEVSVCIFESMIKVKFLNFFSLFCNSFFG